MTEAGTHRRRGDDRDRARPRTAARVAAVQALYQIEMSDLTPRRVVDEFLAHRLVRLGDDGTGDHGSADLDFGDLGFGTPDGGHFTRVVAGASADREAVDGLVSAALPPDWPLSRLDSTLRALLRAGAWELLGCGDVPAAVVISEYVDVSHAFHGDREPAFVNGLLDAIARRVREGELADAGRGGR